jgi:hypothetical protein
MTPAMDRGGAFRFVMLCVGRCAPKPLILGAISFRSHGLQGQDQAANVMARSKFRGGIGTVVRSPSGFVIFESGGDQPNADAGQGGRL